MSTESWIATVLIVGCTGQVIAQGSKELTMNQRVKQYAVVRLEADLDHLSAKQKKMIAMLIEASGYMNDIFWQQSYGDKSRLLGNITDPDTRRLVEINFGPWDRLGGNAPFVAGVGPKPAGAAFYPADMTKKEFEAHLKAHPDQRTRLRSLYTVVRRDGDGNLFSIPYSERFADPTKAAAAKLRQASDHAEDDAFRKYLRARAEALLSDDYRHSDMLWMDMKSNPIDVVIGPIETYEDQLFGYKAAHEAYVLVKDITWSKRLSRYADLLPELQRGLPVEEKYKQESPGSNSDLNAYEVVFYAGDCNAGAKTIAINLPNDEVVQLEKGTRRLQLKNAMRAKFDRILVPISKVLIVPDQQKHITFDAFFGNTMFHEVAHGLGIKQTLNGRGTVRTALRELSSALEEGKADILGLYMVTQLMERGDLTEGQIEDYYVTFMAGIFRSVRFGASSAHGRANMLRFNYFEKMGAFVRGETGRYRVNLEEMKRAVESLSAKILRLQGDGDYDATQRFVREMGQIGPTLRADLERLQHEGIPVDIVFEQGAEVLGL